ncbi:MULTISPECIES: ATP-binding protein [Moraxella]|uniref:endopeptidase La n=1 Tax=Moraxella catarrhalis TaxID=480 RepID=A0A7Z0UX78_MORCA|nr:ATP-binding protein [Moraxella catarrhalis]OAU99891.1 ATP-dependent protease La Type II [Moraxella catarrhalis]STY81754.1 ATP-dependent protease Lon [Moraxella catarrhalis]
MKDNAYHILKNTHRLQACDLKRYTDPKKLPKSSRARLPKPDLAFGQSRAIKALNTALDIRANGYHVFAVGENGLGKRTLVTRLLTERAKQMPTPNDWVYVHHFADARRPIAIDFPAGMASVFQQKVHKLWQDAKKKLAAKLLGDTHQSHIEVIKSATVTLQHERFSSINDDAKNHNLMLKTAADGRVHFMAIDDQKPIDTQALSKLQKQLSEAQLELGELEDSTHDQLEELHQSTAQKVLEPMFKPILASFNHQPKAVRHLNAMLDDMVKNVARIINEDDENFVAAALSDVPSRYAVNVLVSHKPSAGAPIVFEDLPTHLNLLGHIEYTTELGTVLTDVSMIRAGALHKANGGYLLLEAQSLLEHPYAWQGLKRALQSKQIKISSLEQMLTLTGSLSLEPDSVALDVKVILLGEADLYYELLEFEPEFNSVFKVRADFHDDIKRDDLSEHGMVLKMVDMIKAYQLPAFDNTAFAVIIDKLSELSDDKNKLDLHADRLAGLIVESARIATLQNDKTVTAKHVQTALDDITERTSYLKDLYWQEILNGQQIICTKGWAVGQINALTVISYADSEFGLPARLTALIQPNFGQGEILDIERDVELGGSLHAKGMLIMSSFLRALFSEFHELNFSASLAFEQSYGQIDGDSATLAEACALLSALANIPIAQNLAITGSMNQLGQAQAVGGVNAKIAGFFDACRDKGLDGNQGVILPRANIAQLMLRDDIVQAVKDEQFHIYAIDHITDALALLSGMPIDDKNKHGEYKRNTLFGKIVKRLESWVQDDKDDKDNRTAKN